MRRSFFALFALFTVVFLLMPQILSYAEEDADSVSIESLFYDDRVDMTGKEVAIIDAGTPTSYQVGYGVERNTVLDTAVVTLDGDTLIATGIGKAIIQVDGTTYEVTVSAAPISLLLLIGQSNMRGSEGNADQSIVCPDGMVYSSHGDDRGTANPVMTLSNARSFAASALAGDYCSINVEGTADCISGYPLYNLTDAGTGKIGLDSGLGFEWVKQTDEKVWLVNAAVGGTTIASWQPGASCYKKASALFSACQETLQAEISAGHYTLSHMGYFWCQGCSDNDGRSAEWYVDKFLTMHTSLQKDLAFDHDGNAATKDVTFEFAGIIPVRAGHAHFIGYRDGTSQDTTTAKYYESFLDLRFTGPRVAQYWLANNPDLPDIWNVCTIGDDWVWMPDGANGVTAYFQEHYEGGTVDYTTQVRQSASWYTPTTPKAVHDSIHYNQIGYNELGREAARNTLVILGEIEAPTVDTTVNLLGWDGYTEIDDITAAATGASGTLVVPVISPAWKSKAFTYTLSEGLEWNYYDLLATDTHKDGTLSIGCRTVTVHQDVYHTHLAQLPVTICCGLNLWNELEHDAQYFADGTGWSVHSSGTVYSVTIPVKPGDILYATSFCAAGANGNSSIDGIFITYFGEYDVVRSLAPSEVYSEFMANEGYLVVPDGVVAVNIPMWSNSDDNKLFLLNHDHRSADSVQTTAPTCTEGGVTTHTCGICSNSYHESVPATGHTEASIPAVAATCTATGLTEGSHCSVCNEVLIAQEGIDALGHSFAVVSIVPTPTAKGYSIYTCTRCSDSYRTAWLHENAYKGLKIACVGDSITAAYGVTKDKTDYVTLLAQNLGMDYIRLGVSGTTLCTDGSRTCNIGQLTESKLNGADVVTILMGINDFCAAGAGYYELGDINSRDTSTIYGAMRMWCERIVQLQKTDSLSNTKFYFVTPVICSWNNSVTSGRNWDQSKTNIHGYTLRDMCNAIIEVANCYGISVIDLNILSGMYYVDAANNNTAVFGGDGVHPGEKGHAMMADALANILLQSDLRDDHSHVFGSWITTTWPSCQAGEQQRVCNICFATEGRPLEPNGSHRYRTVITASTCETAGYTTYTCSICNDSYTADETPAAGHAYDDGVETTAPTYTKEGVKTFTCTTCGDTYTEVIPALDYSDSNPYKGKVFSIMGDSISTFAGYIPTADGFNRTHLARYPQDNLLTDVYATWWMQAIVDLDAKLGINDSWRGATVSGAHPVTSGDTGENAAMSNLVRIQNLGSNGTPDVILFYGGTNDIAHVSKIGSFDPKNAPSTVDLTTMKWDNLADAYAHTLLRMKHYYPDAVILALLPTYTASYYSDARLAQANDTLADICEYYGIPYIDLRDCGITADDLPDGIHPGEKGMDLITAAVIDALLVIDLPAGENVVYGVKHNLSNATASRGYYQGISAGTSFEETLTGDNLSVTVTMGGKDITAACYSNGQIFIEKVTGALEITAKSPFSLGNHLQEIPSDAYNNTNLWQVLKPEKGYFKGAEWVSNYSSVTIPVTAGDQLWATSFGASGENGGSMNGIRVTYFDAYGMLATIEPDAVYDEFQQNGYLTVPEGATAVCITMWTNTNAELYLLTLPDGPVLPGSHLQSIPTPVCSGVNLWQVLKPEKGYFKGATWVDYYSSVTIPVTAGDQLWATSFGASGDNGGTINGIRVTYFDAHGMLSTLEATTVYEEFLKNGCVTVPEHAIAVNVVMWAGDASDELYILNLEHNYDDGVETLAPTCTADGVKTYTCEICGSTSTETIPAAGHTKEAIPAVAPSCTDTGLTEGVQCSICGEVLVVPSEVAALGHSHIAVITAPTCTEKGFTTYTCSTCGDSYVSGEVGATGHNYDDGVITTTPACTAGGIQTFTCEICGDSYTETISATGHMEEAIPAVAPTCTAPGLTAGVKCSVCGEILTTQTEIAVLGHTYDAGIETTAPTCTEDGIKTFTCTVCGNACTEVITATGHNYEPSVTGSTCTSVGYTTYTCSACGDSYASDETPASGHSYDAGVVTTAPACTEEGVKTFTCSACGISYTESVLATGHAQEIIPAVPPTCTETGLTAGMKCSVCSEILTAQTEVAALGHSYNSGVETTAPTCTAAGVKTFTCGGCGNSYTEVLPALGHTETTLPTVAPTCTTVGKTEGLHCNVCGTVFTPQDILPALGHTEGEPVITVEPTVQTAGIRSVFCDTCGELIHSESITVTGSLYIPGDADDNGRVDIYDALLVMQYSAGWDVTPNLLNADISKDGIVDLYDAVMILQYCAGTSFDSALRTLLEKAEELLMDVMTILEHPQDQHVIKGQQAVFRLSAAGAGLQYQWYIDRGNGDGWRPIAGAISDTYTISTTQMNDDGCRYRCGITDAFGRQIMSNPATLYVEPAVELPQTGDQSNLLLWTTLMAVSLCCLVGLVVANKRYPMLK